jgi:hypothetical protein
VLPVPAGSRALDYTEGQYWANQIEGPSAGKAIALHFSTDGKHWHREGFVRIDPSEPTLQVHALGNGRFLMIAIGAYRDGNGASKFALGHLDEKGEIVPRKLLDMGMSIPIAAPRPAKDPRKPVSWAFDGVRREWMVPFLALGSTWARTSSALVVCAPRVGYFWCMNTSAENPSFRLVRLHRSIDDARVSKGETEWSVLGMQTMPDGHLVIASREEDAVNLGAIEARKEVEAQRKDQVARGQRPAEKPTEDELAFASIRLYPKVEWWDLDPVTGRLTRTDPPAGLPDKLRVPDDLRRFALEVQKDGTLILAK